MCGRTACSRSREGVRCACAYRPSGVERKTVKPKWLDSSNLKYNPSFNICPQSNTPVLLSCKQPHVTTFLDHDQTSGTTCAPLDEIGNRVLQVMKWGLVPNWYRGESGKFPTLLNNCRSEGIMDKPSFRNAIQRNQRCVVLVDGFFEWNRKSSHKQPYLIHFADTSPTEEMIEVSRAEERSLLDKSRTKCESMCKESGDYLEYEQVTSGRILTVAGLFDVWRGNEMEEPLYTYTVITVEAHASFAHIHDRMPVILDGAEAIEKWLEPTVPTQNLLPMLQPSGALAWYPVSSVVNNVKNKTMECVMRIDPSKQVSKNQNTLLKWFTQTPGKQDSKHDGLQAKKAIESTSQETHQDSPPLKRPRLD